MTDEDIHGSRIQPEMLVGISAVIIGLCALGVSLYETSLMREEQRAAVMPLLELSRSYYWQPSELPETEPRLLLHAENVGIGPARVLNFRVTVDGDPQPTWEAAIRQLLALEEPVSYGQSTINGRTIPPDRSVTMLDLNDTEFTGQIMAEFDRLDFEACFCSIFDECWTTSYSTFGVANSVESCERSDNSFVE